MPILSVTSTIFTQYCEEPRQLDTRKNTPLNAIVAAESSIVAIASSLEAFVRGEPLSVMVVGESS